MDIIPVKIHGESLIVVYPIPEIGCDPYKYNLSYKRKSGIELESLFFPVNEYDERNKFVIDVLDDFVHKNSENFVPLKLRPIFCNRSKMNQCSIIENSVPLYLDDDHLSSAGAIFVVDKIIELLVN